MNDDVFRRTKSPKSPAHGIANYPIARSLTFAFKMFGCIRVREFQAKGFGNQNTNVRISPVMRGQILQ